MTDYITLAAQYQADVLKGSVKACKWVRLACERNRKDLDRQSTEGFPFRFDPERGRRICQMAEMLPHIKGPKAFVTGRDEDNRPIWNTIQLEPWQCWYLTTMFGWVHQETGLRRFRVSMLLVPRKNAKSTIAAVVVLYMLTSDGESGAECYSAATTRDQAKVVAEIAWEMAKRSPSFCEYFGVRIGARTTFTLTVPATGGKFAPLSADAHTLDALNVSLAVVDELHAHKTRAVWDVLDTATGARLQPLLLITTTAGVELGGICHEKLEYLQKLLQGALVDEAFFGVNYTVDSAQHTDKIEVYRAIHAVQSICSCQRVRPIQIEQFWREACAKHATTSGIGKSALLAALSIPIGKLRPEGCVTVATRSGSSPTTQDLGHDSASQAGNGDSVIETSETLRTSATDKAQRTDGRSTTSTALGRTESQANNIEKWSLNREGDAPSARECRNVCMWITATAVELFGDSFARSATARSAFSETLRSTLAAHSSTCSVRKAVRPLDDGTVEIDLPADDWKLASTHEKANPNYGVSVQPDDLTRKVTEATHSQAATNNFLTKHLNVWVRAASTWMPMDRWLACPKLTLTIEQLKAYPCWICVDLAEVRDVAALIALFKLGPATWAFVSRLFLPEETVAKSPIAQMSGWVHEGYLASTDGDQADFQRVEDEIVNWCDQFTVKEIDFDRALASQMQQNLKRRLEPRMGRDAVEKFVVTVPQTVETMNPAMQMVERLVLSGKLQHEHNPVMAWMVSNIVVERNHKDEIYPRKAGGKDSPNKIDGPVALFTGLSQAMRGETTHEPQLLIIGGRK